MIYLYNEHGDQIRVPDDAAERLTGKGWSMTPPGLKRIEPTDENEEIENG